MSASLRLDDGRRAIFGDECELPGTRNLHAIETRANRQGLASRLHQPGAPVETYEFHAPSIHPLVASPFVKTAAIGVHRRPDMLLISAAIVNVSG
jgi:hypothetical protein